VCALQPGRSSQVAGFLWMKKRKYVALSSAPSGRWQDKAFPGGSSLQPPQLPNESAHAIPADSRPDGDAMNGGTPCDETDLCPTPTVHNIVSTSLIESGAPIDLIALSRLLPFSFYDRSRFAAITIRIKSPDCTTLLFSSGKLVVTGGRDWFECVLASLCVCRILRDAFPSRGFKLVNCEVQNIVGHVELPIGEGGMLDLQSMYSKLELNCLYQRQMFPGLIYRPEASPVVLLCFYSGKVVITGGKTVEDVYEGWKKLWPTVRVFMRKKA
jgi:transcription initiation factor TFIID TATA-box-binding protein